jgi:hypothetical protein
MSCNSVTRSGQFLSVHFGADASGCVSGAVASTGRNAGGLDESPIGTSSVEPLVTLGVAVTNDE